MSDAAARERFALWISYRGTAYAGWQRQPAARTVQAVLEEALERLLGEATRVHGAGRTDAGVHARGQVAHLDARAGFPCRALVLGTNTLLPEDVRVHWAGLVTNEFHARYSAAGKEYRYRLSTAPVLDALEWPYRVPLPRDAELERLSSALSVLPGEHDFAAFASSGGSHRGTRRTLFRAELVGRPPRYEIRFAGNGFLRGMVRALVGTLFEIARGRMSEDELRELLRGGSRAQAGAAAPARGLVLERVWYPRACRARASYPEGEQKRLLGSPRR